MVVVVVVMVAAAAMVAIAMVTTMGQVEAPATEKAVVRMGHLGVAGAFILWREREEEKGEEEEEAVEVEVPRNVSVPGLACAAYVDDFSFAFRLEWLL